MSMRVALIGCGRIGRVYAKHLASRDRTELSLYDVSAGAAASVATEIGGEVRPDLDAVVDGADAAIVTSSTESHAGLVQELLDRGVPTFCEKPLALSIGDTDRIGATVEKRGVPLWVGFQRHFDAGFDALRRRIAAGELGRLYLLRLYSHDKRCPPIPRLAVSGSVFHDLMLHDFDLVRWLTGQEIRRIAAFATVLAVPQLRELNDFDTVTTMLELEDGSLAVLTAGRHQPGGYDVRAEVLGSADCVSAGLDERTPMVPVTGAAADRPASYEDYRDRFADAYIRQIDAFLAAVAGGPVDERAGTWQDSRAAVRLAEAAQASVRAGAAVDVVEA